MKKIVFILTVLWVALIATFAFAGGISSQGDMRRGIYDFDKDGIVNESESAQVIVSTTGETISFDGLVSTTTLESELFVIDTQIDELFAVKIDTYNGNAINLNLDSPIIIDSIIHESLFLGQGGSASWFNGSRKYLVIEQEGLGGGDNSEAPALYLFDYDASSAATTGMRILLQGNYPGFGTSEVFIDYDSQGRGIRFFSRDEFNNPSPWRFASGMDVIDGFQCTFSGLVNFEAGSDYRNTSITDVDDIEALTISGNLNLIAVGNSTATLRTDINSHTFDTLIHFTTNTLSGIYATTESVSIATNTLQGNIDTEESTRIAADNTIGVSTGSLRTDLDNEIIATDNNFNTIGLSTASLKSDIIATGVSTGTLRSDINTEINDRISADQDISLTTTTLQVNIDNEESARISGDNSLGISTTNIQGNIDVHIIESDNKFNLVSIDTDTLDAIKLNLTGGTMLGDIDMGSYLISNSSTVPYSIIGSNVINQKYLFNSVPAISIFIGTTTKQTTSTSYTTLMETQGFSAPFINGTGEIEFYTWLMCSLADTQAWLKIELSTNSFSTIFGYSEGTYNLDDDDVFYYFTIGKEMRDIKQFMFDELVTVRILWKTDKGILTSMPTGDSVSYSRILKRIYYPDNIQKYFEEQ